MHHPCQIRRIKRSNRSIGWLAGIFLGLALSTVVRGQAVTILSSFGPGQGTIPTALVQGKNGNFYGTMATGGTAGDGSVFAVTPQGTVAVLHDFGDGSFTDDGATPTASLVQAADGDFYGTTSSGGSAGEGTVFKITSAGAVTILHSFGDNSVAGDGAVPRSSLVQGLDGNLYGTTSQGGSAGEGTVFKITTQGVVTIVHSFGDGSVPNDGAAPMAGLVQDAQGNFYGVTYQGGAANQGTVFTINSQRQESVLYSFSQATSISFTTGTVCNMAGGAGGYFPNSRLIMGADGNLYGTTAASGYGFGAIYKITPAGQETVLHYFGDGTVTNDGRETIAGPDSAENVLVQGSDGNFYGMTSGGGAAGEGALFEMTPSGQITILHSFGDGTLSKDGTVPGGGLTLGADGNFYGTTSSGGSAGAGTIFEVVSALPAITSSLGVCGALGADFSYQTIATQSPTAYSATGLPTGLGIDTTGLISGTPISPGTSSVTLTATNGAGSTSAMLVITIVPPPVITSLLSEFGSTSATFTYQITASGTPASYGATGLPTGLSVNGATGLISGTPTETGTFPVTISATNAAGTASQTLTLIISSTAPALSQEYVLLHSFNDGSVNGDGSYPGAMISGTGSTLYGVTTQGGSTGSGTIFNLAASGEASVLSGLGGNSGWAPQGLIRASDGNFYGTTQYGGSANDGTLFKITPAGVVTLLHTFGDGTVTNDGANPQGGIIQGADGNFYGTTQYGGSANLGVVFELTPQGTVTIIHSFGDGSVTNDGAQPVAALVEDGGVFYGTTLNGGVTVNGTTQSGDSTTGGTVFRITATGTVTILHCFGDGTVANDGQLPHAALTFNPSAPGILYGTTVDGGSVGKGTIFEITTAGVETILHNFGDGSVTNDGINPLASVIPIVPSSGSQLIFGTTQNGGSAGDGVVFQLDSSNNLTIIHNFSDGTVTNDGATPLAALAVDASGNLYGTTVGGGTGSGTTYAIAANLTPPTVPTVSPGPWAISGTLPMGLTFDASTGAILGTPSAANAVGGYTVSITSPQNVTSSVTFKLTQTFGQWATAQSTSSVATDAPRKDGVPNLLKYLADINPNAAMSATDFAALPAVGMDTSSVPGRTYLALTYRQSAAMSGTVVLETSSDLQNWQPVQSRDLLSKQVSTLSNGDAMMEMGVPANTSGNQFIRLNITSQ